MPLVDIEHIIMISVVNPSHPLITYLTHYVSINMSEGPLAKINSQFIRENTDQEVI